MCHWQWFLLGIAIFFVVSNGGERINRRRSINVGSSSKKRRETPKPEELSTNVKFPLWVTISGLGSIGATTQYTKINDKLYEFKLPFLVLVQESDVCANRSAKQDKNLAYPFWVRITEIHGEYANQTVEGKVRLAFPFDLEVARMSLMSTDHGVEPATRSIILGTLVIGAGTVAIVGGSVIAGTIAIAGAGAVAVVGSVVGVVAAAGAVILAIVGAIVVAHVIRAAINTLWEAAVEIFRPHTHEHGLLATPKTLVGAIVGKVTGAIVSFVPYLGPAIQAGMIHIFQTFGDSLITFVKELFTLHVFGDIRKGINIIINIFYCLPFVPWRKYPEQTPTVLLPPPPIIVPQLPPPPPTDINKMVVQIYYGQTTIPDFPGYIIVWPGTPEPPVTDSVIVRPIVPTLPHRPNIRLVWPLQSTNNVRPNVILIRPGQRFIPGYVNVFIAWPSDTSPPPYDADFTIIRPYDRVIPNIVGVVLMWPGQPPNGGPIYINLLPGQRQSPEFPTIVFRYPGDPAPPNLPGITVASPPTRDIPGYPGIQIMWPPEFGPPSQVYPPSGPVKIGPGDFQVPGLPNVLIKRPGQPQPRPMPGISYVEPGQPNIPGHPEIPLQWPTQQPDTERFQGVTVNIPPGLHVVPGFPDYPIDRPGYQSSRSPRSVRPGDKTLPDNPYVSLGWLDRPTDLAVYPSPDILDPNSVYDGSVRPPYRRKRNVKRSVGEVPAFLNQVETPESEFLRIWKTDVTGLKYGGRDTTFNVQQVDATIGGYGKAKSAHEDDQKYKHWNFNIKKSQLRQRIQQLFGLSCQG